MNWGAVRLRQCTASVLVPVTSQLGREPYSRRGAGAAGVAVSTQPLACLHTRSACGFNRRLHDPVPRHPF
jgi:hypothetical protein